MADCACRCVDGADLGMPEYGACIANLDHMCQVHNPHEYNGAFPGECQDCGERYSDHAVRHNFIPTHADAEGTIYCGVCGVAFDLHGMNRKLDRWNQESEDRAVAAADAPF